VYTTIFNYFHPTKPLTIHHYYATLRHMLKRDRMRYTATTHPATVFTRSFVNMVAIAFLSVFRRRGMPPPTVPDDHVLTDGELELPYLRGKRRRKFIYGEGK